MKFFDSLVNYLAVSAPYLLIGLTAAGFIHQVLNLDKFKNWVKSRSHKSVFLAALFGVPLPLCSCSVIPSAVTLKKSGASNASTSSFLISTPESGVDSIMMTYSMMDLPMTIIRPISAFITAFTAGILQLIFKTDDDVLDVVEEEKKSCCHGSAKKKENFVIASLKYGYGKLTNDIAFWLSIGILLGALIDTLVPADFFLNLNPHLSRLGILMIGIPLYICATASTPIAASLVLKGMSPGAALLLMLVGPATNISNIMVLQKYLGKRAVAINIAVVAIVSLLLSYVVDFIYSSYSLGSVFKVGHHHHDEHGMISYICSFVLVILLLKGVWIENIAPKFKKEKAACH